MTGYRTDSYSERALALLEKDVCYLAHNNWGYGMEPADVAQELRFHLWRKLHTYHPGKAELRTWAQSIMRRKLIDMSQAPNRSRRELLDSKLREFYDDLGDQENSSEWEYEEVTVTTLWVVQPNPVD